MPTLIRGSYPEGVVRNIEGGPLDHYKYKYPYGLDLRPGGELHESLRTEIWQRASESHNIMQNRFESWKEIDHTLTAYIAPDSFEKTVLDNDPRKPVSIVIPVAYAALDVNTTFLMSLFGEPPVFRYSGQDPTDEVGAVLLTKVIQAQVHRAKMLLNLHTLWRDSYAYGIGVVTPIWNSEYGSTYEREPQGLLSKIGSMFGFSEPLMRESLLWEGNYLENVDPYCYLPDPNVPSHDVQKGEYVGWVVPTNRMVLLAEEAASGGNVFNARYLRGKEGRSTYGRRSDLTGRADKTGTGSAPREGGLSTEPIDKLYMYINLVPKEWKIGDSEYPEKWLFALAGDDIIVEARPLGLTHNRYPVVVGAPDYDGYSVAPISRMEIGYGMQKLINWLINAHVTSIRKSLNDMLVVDPQIVNMGDLRSRGPGKLIRTRKSRWGMGAKDAVVQLDVRDATQQHIQDAIFLLGVFHRILGTSETLQGALSSKKERVQVGEVNSAERNALSRQLKSARVLGLQCMQDLGYMLAMQTQQLISQQSYVDITGEWESRIRNEYGVPESRTRLLVSPNHLRIPFDVVEYYASVPGMEDTEAWTRLFDTLMKNPEMARVLNVDLPRVFLHVARQLGARNVEEFIKRKPVNAQVMPTEDVMQQREAGNLVPVGQL